MPPTRPVAGSQTCSTVDPRCPLDKARGGNPSPRGTGREHASRCRGEKPLDFKRLVDPMCSHPDAHIWAAERTQSAFIQVRVVELRRARPGRGPHTIAHHLPAEPNLRHRAEMTAGERVGNMGDIGGEDHPSETAGEERILLPAGRVRRRLFQQPASLPGRAVDSRKNPFAPGAGTKTPALFGRADRLASSSNTPSHQPLPGSRAA
jgi:hypothetical protein